MSIENVALKILVVEDNDELRAATLAYLQKHGHYVRGVSMAEDIDDMTGGFFPDVYIIDLKLPGENGLSLTRRLRASHPDAGIIITTARTQFDDKLMGYESGADHYLPKPVHPKELLACTNALGKRLRVQSQQNQDTLSLNLRKMLLIGLSSNVNLTESDVLILSALIRAPGQSLERWQIAEIIAGNNSDGLPSTATMEMRITRLRKKLINVGAPVPGIRAMVNVGYKLCCPVVLQ